MNQALKFNYPSNKSPQEWIHEFEAAFEDFRKELNRPQTEFVSPYNPNSKILATSDGGWQIIKDGVVVATY